MTYHELTRLDYKLIIQKNWKYILTISNLTRTEYYGTWVFDSLDDLNIFCRAWLLRKATQKEQEAASLLEDAITLKELAVDFKVS
jgi:hypothetical protein